MLVEHGGDGDVEVMDALLRGCALEVVDVGADDFSCRDEALIPALSLDATANYLHENAELGLSRLVGGV